MARQGTDVGIDPHKRTLTATVLDRRGGLIGTRSFRVSGEGHRELEAWATSYGRVQRWGIEGASGLGRHTSIFLARRGYDVRDVNPGRTAEQSRKRRQGKTDKLDSLRIAQAVQADPGMPLAFKRAPGDAGPDECHELLALWHKARRWVVDQRRQLLTQAEPLLCELPEELRSHLPEGLMCGRAFGHWQNGTRRPVGTRQPRCACSSWTLTAKPLGASTHRRKKLPSSSGNWSTRLARAWAGCAGSPSARPPSSWSRWATLAASPVKGARTPNGIRTRAAALKGRCA